MDSRVKPQLHMLEIGERKGDLGQHDPSREREREREMEHY